jgi:Trk-type K+ transport system membrane component
MVIGPDYVEAGTKASYAVMWLLSLGMLLGRLEIFPAAYAISNIGEEIHYHHTLRRRRRQDAAAASMEE